MDILLLLLRLGLAGVMALAGAAKLADLDGSRKAFEGFGVPPSLTRVGPVLLSIAEIAIAALVLFTTTSWIGAVGALVLLLLFIGQMAYQLAKGNAPDCHCFGQVYSAPVSASSVMRNVVFAIPAAVLVVRGQNGQGAALTDPSVNVLELGLGAVIVALMVAGLAYMRRILERQDQILKHIEVMEIVARDGSTVEREEAGSPHEGLPIGAFVPDFEATDLRGRKVALADLSSGSLPVLFMFVSPNCTPCRSLIPEFQQWITELDGKLRFAFVSSGTAEENIDKFGEEIGSQMVLQKDREVAGLFRANWTPTAVLMDKNGRIASHLTAGDTAIRSLLDAISSEDLGREGVHFTNGQNGVSKASIGQPVPEIKVADINGREITSDYFKGKPTLVTFWSTTCPHCVAMLEDLRKWDKAKGRDEPNLIVFSDGDAEAHASFDLESPIVLDPGHKTAGDLGMYGTPSAVLVNENGVFISETAIGAPDIWALIGKRK